MAAPAAIPAAKFLLVMYWLSGAPVPVVDYRPADGHEHFRIYATSPACAEAALRESRAPDPGGPVHGVPAGFGCIPVPPASPDAIPDGRWDYPWDK